MTDATAQTPPDTAADRRELAKEGATMALYVAVCLLAALSVARTHEIEQLGAFKVIWGTTIGLAAAHWFAFRLSARLVSAGSMHRHDVEISLAQFAGALVVAVLATVPVLLVDESAELDTVRVVVAAFIAVVGFAVARSSGASPARSTVYAAATLVLGLAIAVLKNTLGGH